MALLPKVKLKAVLSFPATVIDGMGVDITKTNGAYRFDISFDDFAPPVATIQDAAHQNALLWNSVTNAYVLAPVTVIGAGGAVPEAPNDGKQYGRQSLSWTQVISGGSPSDVLPVMDGVATPGTSALYSRGDHAHPTDTSRAPIASPVFTGDPQAPTPSAADNDTSIATTAFVKTALASAGTPSNANPAMDGVAAPGVATAYSRGDHVHPTDTSRAPLASPVFTGDPQAPTPAPGDNDTSIATTSFVGTAITNSAVAPATAAPIMDSVAAVGTATKYAREDHVHPSDTAKQAADTDLTAIAALSATGIARRTSTTPTWSVGTAVVNAELATMPAFTFKGNNSGGVATPVDVDIAALTAKVSPGGGDFVLLSDQSASGAWKKLAIANFPGASGGITDAPNDGQMYGRQSLAWAVITGGGGASPSNALPGMDGTANAGVSALYSRGDHIHPTDTSRQPLDSELTALAGLVSAVDTLPYFTGSGTAALTAFTAYARTLVAAVDAPTARTTLGLTSAATATPAALTRINDTNVTLTLGGTPATALLQATSITVGWSGTLSAARGGFGVDVSAAAGVAIWTAGVPTFTPTNGTGNVVRTNSPVLTGDPQAPTPTAGDNDTSIATTAFVTAAITAAGSGVSPSNTNPAMDGTAAPGVSALYSRGDHVHPSDTSRAPIASPVFTGDPKAPTPAAGDNDTSIATTAFVTASVREKLSAARTYYVRTDGSDSNNGLANSSGGAFLTFAKAVATIQTIDFNGNTVTIKAADGTYTGGILVNSAWLGGPLIFEGNTATPANCIISTTSSDAVNVGGFALPTALTIRGFKLTTTAAGYGVNASSPGGITLQNMEFGAVAAGYDHIISTSGCSVSVSGNYTISGGAARHYNVATQGILTAVSNAVTLTGTPAFTSDFADASGSGALTAFGQTFSGAATGSRYAVATNGVIVTLGAGPIYFPGNAAGSVASGGQYT